MRCRALRSPAATVLTVLSVACARPVNPPPEPVPTPVEATPATALTANDIQLYLVVKEKALNNVEAALDDVESHGGDVLGHVQELSVAEREAARALGVDWRHFTAVREQIGRLFTAERQHEDRRLLVVELRRARQDIEGQLRLARDQAAHQFLEAQLKALSTQIAKLEQERQLAPARADEMKLIEPVRAELATLQGRQDKVAKRLQELLQRSASSSPTPSRPARGTP
jgi:hypothetical protein